MTDTSKRDNLKTNVQEWEAGRIRKVNEIKLMQMPEGKAWHLRTQEARLRG
jgi:hypothetical protein